MNLVGGYGSSSSDDDEPKQQEQVQQQQQQASILEVPKGKGKAVLPALTTIKQPTAAGDTSKSKRKSSSKKKKKVSASKRKKKSKTVNALVLSPEIQAALARGDALGDSDSDEDGPEKPPKIVRRPAGSNPNDLLSLLPQPSTAASADDILLKNRNRREEAKTAAAAAAAAPAAPAAASSAGVPEPTTTAAAAAAAAGAGKVVEDDESDSDDGEDDLLAGMHAKAAAAAAGASGSDSGAAFISAPLFTLPSRAKPPPVAAAAAGSLLLDEGAEVAGAAPPLGSDAAVGDAGSFEAGAQHGIVGQQWGAVDTYPQGGVGGAGYSGGAGAAAGVSVQYAAYGGTSGQLQQQHQQAQYYHPAAGQVAAGFGGAVQQGANTYEAAEFGGGGKATRRKGRDMERALARGDLGALGSELPVMDLHQGDNEYTPLRTKPITAAMKQEQKHIESSVYDPRSGKTVKTLEPTSTQKRKHQINQLAVQAASMERDLMERSGASRLTKAQTHAKYGW